MLWMSFWRKLISIDLYGWRKWKWMEYYYEEVINRYPAFWNVDCLFAYICRPEVLRLAATMKEIPNFCRRTHKIKIINNNTRNIKKNQVPSNGLAHSPSNGNIYRLHWFFTRFRTQQFVTNNQHKKMCLYLWCNMHIVLYESFHVFFHSAVLAGWWLVKVPFTVSMYRQYACRISSVLFVRVFDTKLETGWPRVIRLSITVQLNGCILLRWINYNRATEDPLICSGYGWIVTCQNITKGDKLGTMYYMNKYIIMCFVVVVCWCGGGVCMYLDGGYWFYSSSDWLNEANKRCR